MDHPQFSASALSLRAPSTAKSGCFISRCCTLGHVAAPESTPGARHAVIRRDGTLMANFAPRVNADNPDPRIACALLMDPSSSMSGEPIDLLNRGLELFCDEIKKDDLARKRAEIMVITFGGVARVEIPFIEGRDLQRRRLTADGVTPMGAALNLALDQLAGQKQAYKQAGLEDYRPWVFVLADGAPAHGHVFPAAAP